MPKLQENTKQNKPEIKLICQFALVSISEDKCLKDFDNGTGFGQSGYTADLVDLLMKPTKLNIKKKHLEALSRQLQSQLRISHENLAKFHNSYEKTTNYELQNPVAIRPPDRGGFLRSPCLFMKYPKTQGFSGGRQ
jgi:hypothetical protein